MACGAWVDWLFSTDAAAGGGQYLKLLYEDVPDGITRGKSWRGTPYQLGDKTYSHGIAFNSTKHILVHPGGPAQRFTAEIGLENNDNTRRGEALGQGSVTFSVLVGGKEAFASPVRRRKDGPMALDLPLGGAREFEIRVKDGGDGRGWDQALWGEAVVVEDGTRLRLQDLPWAGSADANPYGFSFRCRGANSAGLLSGWPRQGQEQRVEGQGRRWQATWHDPAGGLEVRLEAVQFTDFPAVEWVVRLANTQETNTPLLEAIQALDAVLPVPTAGQAVLHWAKGRWPRSMTLRRSNRRLSLAPGSGSSPVAAVPPARCCPSSISRGPTAALWRRRAGAANGRPSSLVARAARCP